MERTPDEWRSKSANLVDLIDLGIAGYAAEMAESGELAQVVRCPPLHIFVPTIRETYRW
jgi:hypothetical protein